ncbi:MAG: phage major capsid protein [Candidatus Thorarchaeota archaeon]
MAYSGSTAAILSNYSYVLKKFYLPAIREQINNATVLMRRLKRNSESVSGKDATIAVHYGRNLGSRALGDGGLLPDAGYQQVLETIVPMKYNYGRITVSGPTIAASRDAKGAYAKAIDYEMKGLIKDVSKDCNRQFWGSSFGILARYDTGGDTSTSFFCQKKYLGTGGAGFGSGFGSKYVMPEGQTGLACVAAGYTAGTSVLVDASLLAPSAVTLASTYDDVTVTDPSISEAAGTVIVKSDGTTAVITSGDSDTEIAAKEMMGLWGIVNDKPPVYAFTTTGTAANSGVTGENGLQGLDESSYSWWQANVLSHASGRYQAQRALTTDLMQEAVDNTEEQLADDMGGALQPSIILTTRAIRRKYVDLLVADKRFVDWKVMDGGYKVIEFNGIPIAVDNDAIDGEMYFLYEPSLQIYQMSDLSWMERDGNVLDRLLGYDAYEATLFWYAELGCSRRNVNTIITDLDY